MMLALNKFSLKNIHVTFFYKLKIEESFKNDKQWKGEEGKLVNCYSCLLVHH